jgi:hypothetical protein
VAALEEGAEPNPFTGYDLRSHVYDLAGGGLSALTGSSDSLGWLYHS